MAESSPAVERAEAAARSYAAQRDDSIRLADWLLGLLREEWGRPAELVGSLGVDLETILGDLAGSAGSSPVAPDPSALFATARGYSLALRGDPDFTTDALLLAVIASDDDYRTQLSRSGLDSIRMEHALRGESIVAESVGIEIEPFRVADVPDFTDAARIVDANLNRARESLRVLDDYARFLLNDAFLTGQFKRLRHRLAEASATLPAHLLLGSRDTRRDVGTSLTAAGE